MGTQFVGAELVRRALPHRREDGHKGTFGKVLIVGGAVGYTGAPYLAASAAVRTGCGLVSVGVPESIWPIEAVKCSSAMPFPLPERDGRLCLGAAAAAAERLQSWRCAGPRAPALAGEMKRRSWCGRCWERKSRWCWTRMA